MTWPRSADYRDALQHPLRCLHDADLRRARPVPDEHGRPRPIVGAIADVYELRAGHDRWAVKCYTRTPGGLGPRYGVLFADLLERECPWLVGFHYLDQGISIRGRWYPVVKMRWCDGVPLDTFARQADADTLDRLAAAWLDLAGRLRQAGLAHSDLHPRHVRVRAEAGGALRLWLIDYDCLYTPALAGAHPPEKRLHAAYQHPQRAWVAAADAEADRFGNLVIYTALRCFRLAGPELRLRFDEGLLFRPTDFSQPATSALWQELWRQPSAEVRYLAGRLLLASQGPLAEVPLLHAVAGESDYWLGEDQRRAVEAVLRGEAATAAPAAASGGSGLVFDLSLDEDGAKPANAMSFELEVESDPELTLPGAPTTAVLPALRPPPLPKTSPVVPPLPAAPPPAVPPLSPFAQSRVKVYHTEAWMPQAVAVMKLQGFVRDLGGKVVVSVPGLLRVHLLEKKPAANQSDDLWSFLGLFQQPPPPPRVLSVVELHLRVSEHENQTRLRVDIHFYPGDDPDLEEMEERDWQAYCDKTFCELRGFLMHAR